MPTPTHCSRCNAPLNPGEPVDLCAFCRARAPLRQGSTARSDAPPSVPVRSVPVSPHDRAGAWASPSPQRGRSALPILAALLLLAIGGGLLAAMLVWGSVSQPPPIASISIAGEAIHPSHLYATRARREKPMVLDGFALGDPEGAIAVEVEPRRDHARCVVVLESPGLLAPSRWEGRLSRGGRRHSIRPRLDWMPEALLAHSGSGQATIVATVSLDGAPATRIERRVQVRPIHELPLFEPEAFGAFVNEDHPWIDALLREALDLGVVRAFEPVDDERWSPGLEQVFAVWSALARRGIEYSNIAHTSRLGTQHVRSLDETIRLRQANCADGSFAIASILARIGVPVALVTTPGHMLVAFRPCDSCRWLGLETTIIGASPPPPLQYPAYTAYRARFAAPPHADEWRRFEAAMVVGTRQLPSDGAEQRGRLVPLAELRRAGVMPLPARADLAAVPPPGRTAAP
jgi:hypothetical protein